MSKASDQAKYGLIVVSAPSGAGKSTLCNRLLKKWQDRLSLSVSSTSRAPRGTEKHGVEYFFMGREDFLKQIDQGQFAEWALVHGNYYGTSRATLADFWASGMHVLLDIDVQGAESLRKLYPNRCFTVFIAPPNLQELERRLRGRGTETEEVIQKRMQNARDEMAEQGRFDLVIVNDDLEQAFERLSKACETFMSKMEAGQWRR